MLQNTKDLYGRTLAASDGHIGHLKDFYFDDQSWMVRYVVVDTGAWLTGRLVLIPPAALGVSDPYDKATLVKLSRQEIKDSPSIDSQKPVCRQDGARETGGAASETDDPHLRSFLAVTGYQLQTLDEPLGKITGLLVDDVTWLVRQLIVETGHWYAGKEVLIATEKVERISYADSKVYVNITRAALIENSTPPFAPKTPDTGEPRITATMA